MIALKAVPQDDDAGPLAELKRERGLIRSRLASLDATSAKLEGANASVANARADLARIAAEAAQQGRQWAESGGEGEMPIPDA